MKCFKILKIFTLLCVTFILICSCSMEIQEPRPVIVEPVNNLNVELLGDTARVAWEYTGFEENLSAQIKHNKGMATINDAASFKFGIVDVNTDYSFTVKLRDGEGNYSIGKTVHLFREGPNPVTNLEGVQEGNNVVLSWTLPDTDISNIRLIVDSEEILLPSDATSYTLNNVEFRDYEFKLNVLDTENNPSVSKYLNLTPGPMKIAYLSTASDQESIIDDDERASARWFFENYPDGAFVSFDDIIAGEDLEQYGVIWWHFDQNNPTLPEIAKNEVVVSAITEFHKKGGGLLLNNHAVQYLNTLGRFTADYPTIVGTGEGFANNATWGVNVNIGRNYDESSHPLYDGVQINDIDGRRVIPLIGPGWREDHNWVFVDLPGFYGLGPTDEAVYSKVSQENQLTILGTFDGINDYWMMGVFETLPNNNYDGTSIAIGLGAFEWNQNDQNNLYQNNIERITKNALDYLVGK